MLKKAIKWGLFTAGVLTAGLAVFFGLFFDLDETLNAQKNKYIPELEALLGRNVEVGAVKTTLLPVLGAELRDVVIKGRGSDDLPLLRLERVHFSVELWTAIKSAGTEVRLKALIFDGLEVNLIREADGTLSYEDVLQRLSEGPPAEEAPEPLDPKARQFIENLSLQRIAIENARFHLIDKATGGAPAETYINDLTVELDDVMLSSPFEIHVSAAVLADSPNLAIRTRLGPIPIGDPEAALPIAWIKLKADGIDLAAIAPYLGGAAPVSIRSAQFSADLQVQDPLATRGRITVKGDAKVAELALGQGRPGKAFTLLVEPNIDFHPTEGTLDLTGFKLQIDDMVLTATGLVEGLGQEERPRFQGLHVVTQKFDFDALLARLPDIAAALPKGTKLGGPFGIDLQADGDLNKQDLVGKLDFDGAKILLPGTLDKPKGTPLHADVKLGLTANDLDIHKFDLAISSMALDVKGTVKNFANPQINIRGGTGRFDINGVMRLLPNVRKAVPPDVKIAGQAEIDLRALGNLGTVDAQVKVGIFNADLAVPGTIMKGTGSINATVKGELMGTMAISVDAGLTPMALQAGAAFKKPAGTPLELKVLGSHSGGATAFNQFALTLGPLKVDGSGKIQGSALDVKANIEPFSIAALAQILPALRDTPISTATIGTKIAFTGDPKRLETINAKLENLDFKQGKNDLRGNASIQNLKVPKIRFKLMSNQLDLDEMFPPSGEKSEDGSGEIPPVVRQMDGQGYIGIKKGRAGGISFRNFEGAFTIKNGVIRFSALDFDAYDGHFSGAKTSLNLAGAQPAFDLSLAMKNVNAARLLSERTKLGNSLSGRVTTEIKVVGKGSEWRDISKTLGGNMGLSLRNGSFEGLDLQGAIFKPLRKRIPFLKIPKLKPSTKLRTLAGNFAIANGRMNLKKPLVASTPQGPMKFDGHIGLDATLGLIGTVDVSPKLIAKLTGNKLKIKKAIPVALKIGGSLTDPKITGVDIKALASALAKEAGLAKVEAAIAKAEDIKKKAEAEARKQVSRAKNLANEKKKELEAKARKKKKELEAKAKREARKASKKAEDRAKKEARKMLNKLF